MQIVMKVKPMQFNGENMEIVGKLQKEVLLTPPRSNTSRNCST